jgi:hypothetical protein
LERLSRIGSSGWGILPTASEEIHFQRSAAGGRSAKRELCRVQSLDYRRVLVAALLGAASSAALAAPSTPPAAVTAADAVADDDAGRDRSWIYRYDPMSGSLVAVPPAELKRGAVYNRYDAGRGRWVWSKLAADGSLRYSLGPGSVQQVRSFDLRGTQAEQRRALEKQAPELARLLTIQGARPTLKLDEQGRWQLGPTPHVSSVFDEATGERWEWHGDEPSGVLHSCGRLWAYADGDYLPVR